jgi:hypothetical protein
VRRSEGVRIQLHFPNIESWTDLFCFVLQLGLIDSFGQSNGFTWLHCVVWFQEREPPRFSLVTRFRQFLSRMMGRRRKGRLGWGSRLLQLFGGSGDTPSELKAPKDCCRGANPKYLVVMGFRLCIDPADPKHTRVISLCPLQCFQHFHHQYEDLGF